MTEGVIKILNEWIHDYITQHKDNDDYFSYNIEDESKEILLHLKSSNNSSIRIEHNGDSGTNACGCCEGYFDDYYNIFVDDKLLYEVTISLTDDDYLELIIIHVVQN